MIYGLNLSLQTISKLKEEGIIIKLENHGSFILYQREGGFPEGPLKKVISESKEEDFLIYPVHSIQPEISTNILLRLSEPLIIKPYSKINIYVKLPISIGIYIFKEENQILIDYFSPNPYKYALYGPAANGLICRFYKTNVYSNIPNIDLWNAITKVIIENSSEDFYEIKNIVFPLLNTIIYIDDYGRAYTETIFLNISREGLGTISLESIPPINGLKECPKQFGKIQEKIIKFLMEFGF
ncbi:MAG: DUF432 domain-containing protein [Candidatus Methanomethyliaceae archaeon]